MKATAKLPICLTANLLLFSVVHAQSAPAGFDERFHAGIEGMRLGNYPEAMAELREAVVLNPSSKQGWYQLGLLLGQLADFRGAESAFRRAISLDPDFASAHYNLGLTLIANPQSKLDWPGAIAEFRAALQNRPDYAEAHNLLGAGLTSEGHLEEAISELQQAVRLMPSLSEAHFNLALALEQNGQLETAANEYRAAVKSRGVYPEASTALGELVLRMGQATEAKTDLEIALRSNPDLTDAHHALAGALQSLGKRHDAAIELKIAADLSQRTANALRSTQLSNHGLDLAAAEDLPGANTALRQAILLKPDYGIPHFNLGLILADQGDLAGAAREFEIAISLQPGQAKPWLQLGRVFERQGKFQEALGALWWASRLAPGDEVAAAELASLRAKNPSWEPSGANATSPLHVPAPLADTLLDHETFAKELIAQQDFIGAVGELLRAVALQPADVNARRALAAAYRAAGDRDHSLLENYKVLRLQPSDLGRTPDPGYHPPEPPCD